MALAVVLILLVVATVLFHFLNPWWFTPLASNWGLIDDTIVITLGITGAVFIAINLFLAWALIRFRQREGHRASFDAGNKRLEWGLSGLTTAGIVAMLAPGLYVYSDMIDAPPEAAVVEVFAQQWQWRFRFPGADGRLGGTDTRFVGADNPFGLDPDDPAGRDDVLVPSSELHLPLHQPVRFLLRSQDVLHNFYVPQFRAKMDIVPGMISHFWLTPTRAGRYDILCAELCGIAHYTMRGAVVVEEAAAFRAWLGAQETFAATPAGHRPPAGDGSEGDGSEGGGSGSSAPAMLAKAGG